MTCVKSSQGFDWNQGTAIRPCNILERIADISIVTELFLPSYADHDSQDLEHKQDPVQDIILTDEEAAAMMPQ